MPTRAGEARASPTSTTRTGRSRRTTCSSSSSPSSAIGRSLDLIIPERLRDRHWAGYHEVMATGHTGYAGRLLEVPALHRDGPTLFIAFTVTLRRADDWRPRAIAAVLRDDTARWQERRRLQSELASLRASTGPSNPSASLEAAHGTPVCSIN